MKELFAALPMTTKPEFLLDTCFLYWVFEHQKEKEFLEFCNAHVVALSTFTIAEVLFHAHDVSHVFRERFRHVQKQGLRLYQCAVEVSPGDRQGEIDYISKHCPDLLHLIPDHSDAIIAVLAKELGASLLTRDKHHLFTVELENYFQKQGISVLNNFPE